MATFVGIALIAVIVTVDNALLAGLLLPTTSKQKRQSLIMTVGILLGISQVILATSVEPSFPSYWHCLVRVDVYTYTWDEVKTGLPNVDNGSEIMAVYGGR